MKKQCPEGGGGGFPFPSQIHYNRYLTLKPITFLHEPEQKHKSDVYKISFISPYLTGKYFTVLSRVARALYAEKKAR